MDTDPAITDPELYRVVFENERVRVLEYRDVPGDRTHPHRHPDSVMYTLTSFRRRLRSGTARSSWSWAPGRSDGCRLRSTPGRTSATASHTRSSWS